MSTRFLLVLALAAAALAAPAPAAASDAPAAVQPQVASPVGVERPHPGELKLAKVTATAPATDAAAVDGPRRGSFWWLVGVIVVAGVILAIVL